MWSVSGASCTVSRSTNAASPFSCHGRANKCASPSSSALAAATAPLNAQRQAEDTNNNRVLLYFMPIRRLRNGWQHAWHAFDVNIHSWISFRLRCVASYYAHENRKKQLKCRLKVVIFHVILFGSDSGPRIRREDLFKCICIDARRRRWQNDAEHEFYSNNKLMIKSLNNEIRVSACAAAVLSLFIHGCDAFSDDIVWADAHRHYDDYAVQTTTHRTFFYEIRRSKMRKHQNTVCPWLDQAIANKNHFGRSQNKFIPNKKIRVSFQTNQSIFNYSSRVPLQGVPFARAHINLFIGQSPYRMLAPETERIYRNLI